MDCTFDGYVLAVTRLRERVCMEIWNGNGKAWRGYWRVKECLRRTFFASWARVLYIWMASLTISWSGILNMVRRTILGILTVVGFGDWREAVVVVSMIPLVV